MSGTLKKALGVAFLLVSMVFTMSPALAATKTLKPVKPAVKIVAKKKPVIKAPTRGVPRGASGECEDGVISYVRVRSKACLADGGVMSWF